MHPRFTCSLLIEYATIKPIGEISQIVGECRIDDDRGVEQSNDGASVGARAI